MLKADFYDCWMCFVHCQLFINHRWIFTKLYRNNPRVVVPFQQEEKTLKNFYIKNYWYDLIATNGSCVISWHLVSVTLHPSPTRTIFNGCQIVHCDPLNEKQSPLKPLGQLNSNFIWRLLRTRERKFVQMVLVTWPRWPPCPYMVKPFKSLLLQNQKADELGTWYVALGVLGLPRLFK